VTMKLLLLSAILQYLQKGDTSSLSQHAPSCHIIHLLAACHNACPAATPAPHCCCLA
jgi:hypothetical protein